LAVESIEEPEKYPLVSQAQPHRRLRPAVTRKAAKRAPHRRG
jgi:hypothetical protein